MRKRRLKKKIIPELIIIICFSGIIYSCYNIFRWKKNIDDNAIIKEHLNTKVIIKNEEEKEKEYIIDFDYLVEQNNDTIAYLKVNGTNINYIVVKGKDNSYYLNHNYEKKYNNAGWIFSDYRNQFDELDKNIIIYGHNAKDGSMFGTLKNTLNKNWYENKDNHIIILVTKEHTYYYQVFSTYSIEPEDYYISTDFNNNDEFGIFINKLKSRSIYNYNIEVSEEDKILTLSSCTDDGTKRVVLHAKFLKKSDN